MGRTEARARRASVATSVERCERLDVRRGKVRGWHHSPLDRMEQFDAQRGAREQHLQRGGLCGRLQPRPSLDEQATGFVTGSLPDRLDRAYLHRGRNRLLETKHDRSSRALPAHQGQQGHGIEAIRLGGIGAPQRGLGPREQRRESGVALAIVLNVFHLFNSVKPAEADLLRE